MLEVGDHVAHLEVLHVENTGLITVHVIGADMKTPLAVPTPPQVKISTAEGPKVLDTSPEGGASPTASVFRVSDDALKGHAVGRISIEIDGKTYSPEIEHDH